MLVLKFHTAQSSPITNQPSEITTDATVTTFDICTLPSQSGPCRALIYRWYFDTESGECRQFNWGGCRANANNFKTREACQHACHSKGTVKSAEHNLRPGPEIFNVMPDYPYGETQNARSLPSISIPVGNIYPLKLEEKSNDDTLAKNGVCADMNIPFHGVTNLCYILRIQFVNNNIIFKKTKSS